MKSTQNPGRQGLSGVVAALTVGLVLSGATAQNKVEQGKEKVWHQSNNPRTNGNLE